jgi:hypothetical protein
LTEEFLGFVCDSHFERERFLLADAKEVKWSKCKRRRQNCKNKRETGMMSGLRTERISSR